MDRILTLVNKTQKPKSIKVNLYIHQVYDISGCNGSYDNSNSCAAIGFISVITTSDNPLN